MRRKKKCEGVLFLWAFADSGNGIFWMDLLCTRLSGLEPSGCSYWYSLVNVGYAGLFMKCPCTLACEYWELLKNQGSVAFNAFEGYRWRTQLLTRSKALGFGRSMLICCVNHQMKSRRGIELYFLLGHRLLIRLFQDGPRREGHILPILKCTYWQDFIFLKSVCCLQSTTSHNYWYPFLLLSIT